MTQMTLTKDERNAVVHWLNGAGGDNDYFINRPTGNTHLKRTTVRLPGSKWKVRLAYEADTGYPVATGAPIQAEKSGKHEEHPGKATIPADMKPKPAKGILTPYAAYMPKAYIWDDPVPAPALDFLLDTANTLMEAKCTSHHAFKDECGCL